MDDLQDLHQLLVEHPLYLGLNSLSNIQTFMESHVFAVWDFMSLLKALQRNITCVEVPWRPSHYPSDLVRFINQIVVGEESDLDQNGEAISHFALYLRAMNEIGADTGPILKFVSELASADLPSEVKEFVTFNLDLARTGKTHEIAAVFFYGREKLIPEMFTSMTTVLEKNQSQYPALFYYLKRHIEVDGDEHGPLAAKCLDLLCGNDPIKRQESLHAGKRALELRIQLWDNIRSQL